MSVSLTHTKAPGAHLFEEIDKQTIGLGTISSTVTLGQSGALQVAQSLPSVGHYKVNVVVNGRLYKDQLSVTAASPLCVTNAATGSDNIYQCIYNLSTSPKYTCGPNYYSCLQYNPSVCSRASNGPFQCFEGHYECVFNVVTECCAEGEYYCHYLQDCVTSMDDCCQTNPETPIYC